jgi:hypothetical protein
MLRILFFLLLFSLVFPLGFWQAQLIPKNIHGIMVVCGQYCEFDVRPQRI